MTNNLLELWRKTRELENPPVIELLNFKGDVVGAIYPRSMDLEKVVITQLQSDKQAGDKYGLYVPGILIFFNSYKLSI